ncbi:MAG: periplasmic heavy metal sensor [Acidobacteriota bacterium]|nr:periplasmic heavy metal sensor [Acidobacteriota bacterium]
MDAPAKKPSTRWAIGLLIALNLVTLAAIWLTVIRRPHDGGWPQAGRGGPEEVQMFLRRELGLSDKQAKTFEEIRDKFVAGSRPTHDEIIKLKEQILAEMFKPAPDRTVLESLTSRIGVLQGEEQRLLFLHFLDMMAACGPDQKPKFQSILREFMIRIGALEPAGPPEQDGGPGDPPGERPSDARR